MNAFIESAILLSAGKGERLKPLTDKIPKSLIPLRPINKSLVVCLIEKLAAANVRQIVINTCYLGEQIQDALKDGRQFGVKIIYSPEEEALETGGGIFNALSLLPANDNPFLVISSDIFTDYDFKKFHSPQILSRFFQKQIDAHLICAPNPDYHSEGDFGFNEEFLTIPTESNKENTVTYASLGVFHRRLFADCSAGKFRLSPLLLKAIQQRKITGEIYRGQWYNIGTLDELKKCERMLEIRR